MNSTAPRVPHPRDVFVFVAKAKSALLSPYAISLKWLFHQEIATCNDFGMGKVMRILP
jgi:hypothetical protein